MDKNGVDFGVYCRVVLYSWFFEFPLLSGVIIPTNHHLTTISSNVELLNFDTTKNWSFYHFKWCLTARIKSKNVEMTMLFQSGLLAPPQVIEEMYVTIYYVGSSLTSQPYMEMYV